MSARIIAFINFKGGVGKTSNVVNIGAMLAHRHHQKVLIVDLDPQCNSTFWLMHPPDFQPYAGALPGSPILQNTSYQLFLDLIDEITPRLFSFEKAVLRNVVTQDGFPVIQGLDLLTGGRALMQIDEKMCQSGHAFSFTYLFDQLKYETRHYDYILLDCPPNLFPITKNALFFADHVVVPFNPDFLSLSGFKFLCTMLADIGEKYKMPGFTQPAKRISAFILNRAQTNTIIATQARQFLLTAMDQAMEEQLLSQDCCLLPPDIRNCVDVGMASDTHLPLVISHPHGKATEDYDALTAAFVRHFQPY